MKAWLTAGSERRRTIAGVVRRQSTMAKYVPPEWNSRQRELTWAIALFGKAALALPRAVRHDLEGGNVEEFLRFLLVV